LATDRYDIDSGALCNTVRETCRGFWHKAHAREYCLRIGISSWEGLWARFEGDGEHLKRLREWAPRYRSISWREALRKHGVDDPAFAQELAESFQSNRRKHHVLYDDARPVLEGLRQSYKLGLLTNGDPHLQRDKIDGTGIGQYFDAVVVSGEVGVGKPDGGIFEIMISRLRVSLDAALMIGDSLHSDVMGAQAIGMKAAWINRLGRPRVESITPDFEVSNLVELQRILQDGLPEEDR